MSGCIKITSKRPHPKKKDGMEIKFFIYRKRKVLSAADS
jgi:hypothetical protein